MEASRFLPETAPETFRQDTESAQLDALYKDWQQNIIVSGNSRPINEIVADLRQDDTVQDELLSKVSGHIANIAQDHAAQSPLEAYNRAQQAVAQRAKNLLRGLSEDQIMEELIETAIEAVAADQNAEGQHLRSLPALAGERGFDAFEAGDTVLFLPSDPLPWQKGLIEMTVNRKKAYSSRATIGEATYLIPEEETERRQKMLSEREIACALDPEPDYPRKLMPDPELLRLRILNSPIFQQVLFNPSPGFVHLVSNQEEADVGVITDMNHNYIIPMDAWEHIRGNNDYLEAWLASGSKESLARSEELREAIAARG